MKGNWYGDHAEAGQIWYGRIEFTPRRWTTKGQNVLKWMGAYAKGSESLDGTNLHSFSFKGDLFSKGHFQFAAKCTKHARWKGEASLYYAVKHLWAGRHSRLQILRRFTDGPNSKAGKWNSLVICCSLCSTVLGSLFCWDVLRGLVWVTSHFCWRVFRTPCDIPGSRFYGYLQTPQIPRLVNRILCKSVVSLLCSTVLESLTNPQVQFYCWDFASLPKGIVTLPWG